MAKSVWLTKSYVETILFRCFAYDFSELFTNGIKLEWCTSHEAKVKTDFNDRQFINYGKQDICLEIIRHNNPLITKKDGVTELLFLSTAIDNMRKPEIYELCLKILRGTYSYFDCYQVLQFAIYSQITHTKINLYN